MNWVEIACSAEEHAAYFRGGIVAKLGSRLGSGCSRICYDTDYVDAEGRHYAAKIAKRHNAIVQNRFEFALYRYCKRENHAMLKELPIFAAISPCGCVLLVERCDIASDIIGKFRKEPCYECEDGEVAVLDDDGNETGEMETCEYCDGDGYYTVENDLEKYAQNELEYFIHDTHEANWGYTQHDGRPVILDLGCAMGDIADMAEMPDNIYTSTRSANKFDRRRERSRRLAA